MHGNLFIKVLTFIISTLVRWTYDNSPSPMPSLYIMMLLGSLLFLDLYLFKASKKQRKYSSNNFVDVYFKIKKSVINKLL